MPVNYYKCSECGEFYEKYATGSVECKVCVQPEGFATVVEVYCPKCSIKKFDDNPNLAKAFKEIKRFYSKKE